MSNDLKGRQQQVFEFIKQEVKRRGYPPSVREIGAAVGLSSSATVHSHLAKLEGKGLIRRDPTKPRAIEILDEEFQVHSISVPVVGRVTAGLPILATENITDYLALPADLASSDTDLFALIVQGDSMIEAGILDGDQVIVRRQATAYNGEVVVALIDDEATVKRFYKEGDHIRLQPANPTYAPILVDDCTILGRVIGLFRRIL
ncbi:MAG: transcriptional repressor LexA [Bacillota bacterium]